MAYRHKYGCACFGCHERRKRHLMDRPGTVKVVEIVEGEAVEMDDWYDLDSDLRRELANEAIKNLDATLVGKYGTLAIEATKDPAVAAEVEERRKREALNRLADKADEVALAEREYRHVVRTGKKGVALTALGWAQVLVGAVVVDSAVLAWVGAVMALLFFVATVVYLAETKLTALRKEMNARRLEYGRMQRRTG